MLDSRTLSVLSLIARGITNFSEIERHLGIDRSTVKYRVERLIRKGVLRIRAVPNYRVMGLTPLLVVTRVRDGAAGEMPGEYLREAWAGGTVEGEPLTIALYTYPSYGVPGLVERLRRVLGDNVAVFRLSNLYYHVPDPRFVNGRWDEAVGTVYREYLGERPVFSPARAKLDEIDVRIITVLEENGLVKLTEIARRLGEDPWKIHYHYKTHVTRVLRGMKIEIEREGKVGLVISVSVAREEEVGPLAKTLAHLPIVDTVYSLEDEAGMLVKIFPNCMENLERLFRAFRRIRDVGSSMRAGVLWTVNAQTLVEKGLDPELFTRKGWLVGVRRHARK